MRILASVISILAMGYVALAQSASLGVSATSVRPGTAISISVVNGPGNRQDWVGLYRAGAAASAYVDWKYLNNTQSSPAVGVRSATLTFNMPSTLGDYEFRLYPNDRQSPLLAQSVRVKVQTQTGAPGPTPTPTPTPAPPPVPPAGAQFFVSPSGHPGNDGSAGRPWDLQTALNQPAAVKPGATIWLRGGTYRGTFVSNLRGSTSAPIVVRQYPGERAILDGNVTPAGHVLVVQGSDTWYWGFEVTYSDQTRVYHHAVNPDTPGGPDNMRGTGLNVFGPRTKFINLIVHDTASGFGFWQGAIDSEVYGCIVYNNGVVDTQRGHGHGLYIQNQTGTKTIENVISFNNFSTGMKAYTEAGYIVGINFKGIISFNNGSPGAYIGTPAFNTPPYFRVSNLFVGSKGNPSDRISITGSYLYHQDRTLVNLSNMGLGYQPVSHKSLVVQNNYVMGGNQALTVDRWDTATVTGNTLYATQDPTSSTDNYVASVETRAPASTVWDYNTYYDETQGSGRYAFWFGNFTRWHEVPFASFKSLSGFDSHTSYQLGRPTGMKIVVQPNKYEPGRANIAVYNWDHAPMADIDVSGVLAVGRPYELRNVQHLLTGPVLSGVYDGKPLRVRLDDVQVTPPIGHEFTPASTSPEFSAFVLIPR